MRAYELIVYRKPKEESLFDDMMWLMEHHNDGSYNTLLVKEMIYSCMNHLVELAGRYGFYGNLWHCYLTNLLVNNENSYSCGCEMKGEIEGTINQVVLHDMEIWKEFFEYDFTNMMEQNNVPQFQLVLDYESSQRESKVYNRRIRDHICILAKELFGVESAQDMKECLTAFYRQYGVGKLGLHKSFRVSHQEDAVLIDPILNIAHVKLEDLIGYEIPKKKLVDNTEAFVEGRKANNCLLFGDAGTGKSSCIKAIANEYYDKGLRIIEIYKHQFQDLNEVIRQIKNRNYKFILYMDDLSFEEFEIEYKYLKAIIEGGLEKKPENVLIYATSNRRHLIRENYGDKEEVREDMHVSDTVSEKLSLVARFGVTIYFGAPMKKEFEEIVLSLAKRNHIVMPESELLLQANRWELAHGGYCGRTAQQFIDYLLGKIEPQATPCKMANRRFALEETI